MVPSSFCNISSSFVCVLVIGLTRKVAIGSEPPFAHTFPVPAVVRVVEDVILKPTCHIRSAIVFILQVPPMGAAGTMS